MQLGYGPVQTLCLACTQRALHPLSNGHPINLHYIGVCCCASFPICMQQEFGFGLAPFRLGIWTGPFLVEDVDQPLSSWGYGLPLFHLGICTGPFSLGDMDWPLSIWEYGPAPFHLGIWSGPFPVGDLEWPFSGWGYGVAPSRLGIWTGPLESMFHTFFDHSKGNFVRVYKRSSHNGTTRLQFRRG